MKALNRYKLFFLFGLYSVFFISCKKSEITDQKEYYSYLAKEENGLVKIKNVAGIKLKVKYLPIDYLVYNQVKDISVRNQKSIDSLYQSYKNSLTFMLTIGPDEKEDFDVTRVGVESYEQFAERIEEMSFRAQDWMTLSIGGKEFKPEIVRMENLNALERSRNFIIVFNSGSKEFENSKKQDDLCLIYEDNLFNIGTNKFIFKSEDIEALPKFKF